MSNRNVRLKNTTAGRVIVHEPAYGVHRDFPGKGAVQTIPFDTVEQLLWQPGFKNMLTSGILYIDNMQDKIDLQLEEPDTKVPTKIKVLTEPQIITLLKVKNYEEFVEELSTVSVDQANAVVQYAVENNIVDPQKVDYLKQVTGKDIIKMIAKKREAIEAEAAAKEREERRRNEGEFNAI